MQHSCCLSINCLIKPFVFPSLVSPFEGSSVFHLLNGNQSLTQFKSKIAHISEQPGLLQAFYCEVPIRDVI